VTLLPSPEGDTESVGEAANAKTVEEKIPKETIRRFFNILCAIGMKFLYT
jgi:hypothetical protein